MLASITSSAANFQISSNLIGSPRLSHLIYFNVMISSEDYGETTLVALCQQRHATQEQRRLRTTKDGRRGGGIHWWRPGIPTDTVDFASGQCISRGWWEMIVLVSEELQFRSRTHTREHCRGENALIWRSLKHWLIRQISRFWETISINLRNSIYVRGNSTFFFKNALNMEIIISVNISHRSTASQKILMRFSDSL